MRLAMRRFLAFSEAALAEANITSQQYQVLLVVKTSPSGKAKIGDIAEQMLLQHHGAVQLVDRLSSAGLVERIPAVSDKRSVLVMLTQSGETMLEFLASSHIRNLRQHEALLVESISKLRSLPDTSNAFPSSSDEIS